MCLSHLLSSMYKKTPLSKCLICVWSLWNVHSHARQPLWQKCILLYEWKFGPHSNKRTQHSSQENGQGWKCFAQFTSSVLLITNGFIVRVCARVRKLSWGCAHPDTESASREGWHYFNLLTYNLITLGNQNPVTSAKIHNRSWSRKRLITNKVP